MTNTTTPDTTTPDTAPQHVELLPPQQVCQMLRVNEAELIALVNTSQLGAYDLSGQIRFRYPEVVAFASRDTIAA